MIELERAYVDEPETDRGELWSNPEQTHVISKEDGQYWVRDEAGERGAFDDFAQAFAAAEKAWGEVTLAPANRLRRDIAEGRADEIGHFLLEYLADYGAVGIDVQALARQVFERVGADEEAWK
jgi:hypothetical protein